MSDAELEAFSEQLLAEIVERSREIGATKQEAFTQLMLEELVEIGTINDFELCYFQKKLGRGIGRVNGYSIASEESRVDLFTTLFRSDDHVVSISQKEISDALLRASRVFTFAQGTGFQQMDPASEERTMFENIHEASSCTTSLRIFLLTNAQAPESPRKPKVADLDVKASTECYDLVRYFRWKSSSAAYESISIDLREYECGPIPCLQMPPGDADYGAYLAIIPGTLLHRVYEEYGARLMELNVRSFLQNRGKVNKGIRETLLNAPARFLAYNNGISATAEALEVVESQDGLLIQRLDGLQVVNGGQTVASIHRAGKVDGADLSKVYVQAKVSVIEPQRVEELVPRISRYANTQNKVNEADFSANNPFHVEMEVLSRKTWAPGQESRWFYERARGQYQVLRSREGYTPVKRKKFDQQNPKNQTFTKTDLARYMNAWDQKPNLVSLGAQKNFVVFMGEFEDRRANWSPDREFFQNAVAQAILYKAAEAIARQHKFPAYRANAICYSVAYLAYRTNGKLDLGQVWARQSVSEATHACLSEWMPKIYAAIVESAAGRNVTEWAKKQACWDSVRRLELRIPDALQKELLPQARSA